MKNIVVVTIMVLVFLFAGFIFLNNKVQQKEAAYQDQLSQLTPPPDLATPMATPSENDDKITEMKIDDLKVGTGDEAVDGKNVTVHYTGTLTNGTKFDSSLDRNQPFTFSLGSGEVIKGWDMGVKGMKVGGKRKLTIPSELGYGERGAPPAIPANAALVFEVELLKVE